MIQVTNTDFLCLSQWHGLSRAEQAKYYELARRERDLHMQLYPGWSARDNYAKHKKKRRRRDLARDGGREDDERKLFLKDKNEDFFFSFFNQVHCVCLKIIF